MPSDNLWGDLSDLEVVPTPKGILEQQANKLTTATRAVLRGRVTQRESGIGFYYDLDVVVPGLNNYVYTILTINHGIQLYPVWVGSDSPQRSVKCDDEKQYLEVLEGILSSKDVKFILSRLLSQAR